MRTALRRTILFAVAEGTTRGADLLLLPLYTTVLAPADYGLWALASGLVLVLRPVLTLGLQGGILRYFFKFEGSARGPFLVAVLMLAGFAGVLGLLAVSLVGVIWPGQDILGLSVRPTLQLALASVLTGAVFFDLPREMLRAKGAAVAMASGSMAWLPIQGIAVLVLCGQLGLGVDGALIALMISHVANAIVVVWVIRPPLHRPSFHGMAAVVAFSLPMIPHLLAHWVLAFSDRFLLAAYRSLDDVAVYNVGYLVGSLIALPKVAMTSVMIPRYGTLSPKREKSEEKVLASVTSTYAFGIFASGIAATVLIPPGISLFLSDAYATSLPVAGIVLVSSVVLALYNPSANILTIVAGQSGRLGALTAIAALLNVGLNVVLIPRMGVIGAAIATLATYVLLAAGALFMADRFWRVRYPLVRITLGMLIFLVVVSARWLYAPLLESALAGVVIGLAGLGALVVVMRPPLRGALTKQH